MPQRMRSRSSFHKLAAIDAAAQLNQILSDPAIRPPLDLVGLSEAVQTGTTIAEADPAAFFNPETAGEAMSPAPTAPEQVVSVDTTPDALLAPRAELESAALKETSGTSLTEPTPAPKICTVPNVESVPKFDAAPQYATVSNFETVSEFSTVPKFGTVPEFGTVPNLAAVLQVGVSATGCMPEVNGSLDQAPENQTVTLKTEIEYGKPEKREEAAQESAARPKLVRPLEIAQDAELSREKSVYAYMWDKGTVETRYEDAEASPRSKTLELGLRPLAKGTKIPFSSCQAAVNGLILKLDIQRIQDGSPGLQVGARYRIYAFPEILRRRQIAGLNFYVKLPGGGRIFVNENGDEIDLPALSAHLREAVPEFGSAAVPNFGCELPKYGTPPVPNFDSEQETKLLRNKPKPTSSLGLDILRITDAFLEHFSGTDQRLVDAAIDEVLSRVPDVTTDEIVEAIHLKGAETEAGRAKAAYPGKYLQRAVIHHFEGYAFHSRRLKAKARAKQVMLESARATALDSIREELDSHATIWHKVRELVATKVDPHSFSTWVRPLQLLRIAGQCMYLVIPTPEFRHAEKYQDLIVSAASEVQLAITTVRFVTVEESVSIVSTCDSATTLQ